MLKFLADECFSMTILRALRNAGFDVERSSETLPAADDETVLDKAFKDKRIILTEDFDFGELAVRLRLPSHGVVIVALKGLSKDKQSAQVVGRLNELDEQIAGAMVIIEPGRSRLRPLPDISSD